MMCAHGNGNRAKAFRPTSGVAHKPMGRPASRARLESIAPLGEPAVPEVWKTATVSEQSMRAGGRGGFSSQSAVRRRNPGMSGSSPAWTHHFTGRASSDRMALSKTARSVTMIETSQRATIDPHLRQR